MANAARAYQLAGIATFYDDSGNGHRLVLIGKEGTVVWRAVPLPAWVRI
jgi:hypothetical protein